MENILRSIYQERASLPSTKGVLLVEAREDLVVVTDTFDAILLIVTDEKAKALLIKHYTFNEKKIALYVINQEQLNEWVTTGSNRKIFDWLFHGRILFERNDYLHKYIQELKDFPFHERKLKIGIEFAKLIRRYQDGKKLYEQQHYLDAYNHMIHSLHHLGRLAVIEKGFHPEVTLWNQVKKIEPNIFKMYEELIFSEEPLNKKLDLLFLACEFFIHSRTEVGCSHLIEILDEKECWSIQEIIEHEELSMYSVDLVVLVEYLVEKNYLGVVVEESKGKDIYHRYYMRYN